MPPVTFGDITLNNTGDFDANSFIVKYNSIGDVLWARSFGAEGIDETRSIATDSQGNVYVTGFFKQ